MNKIYSCQVNWSSGNKVILLLTVILTIVTAGKSIGQVSTEAQKTPVMFMIFSPDVREENYRNQLLSLSKNPIELDQRNIVVLEIFPTGGLEPDGTAMEEDKAKKIRAEHNISDKEFRIIIVDSVGAIVLNSSKTIENQEIFKLLEK